MKNDKRLWNPDNFIWLSALFSFYPAAILCALNWGRLGQKDKQRNYMIYYSIGFIALIAALIYIPESFAKGVAVGVNVALGFQMQRAQKAEYAKKAGYNGKAPILLPLAACIAVTGLVVWYMLAFPAFSGSNLDFNGNKVFYTQGVSKDEAEKLGNYMVSTGFFSGENKKDIKLDNAQDCFIVSFVMANNAVAGKNETKDTFRQLAKLISKTVFNNAKVKVELCDDSFKPLVTLE